MSEKYEDLVEECVETRTYIDDILHPRYSELKKAFESLFNLDAKVFKRVNDLIYYQGGYPSENSPAKAEALADDIASALMVFDFIGNSQLKRLLEKRGININISSNPLLLTLNIPDEKWNEVIGVLGVGYVTHEEKRNSLEILQQMIKEAQDLQGQICSKADSIKIEGAEIAEKDHKVDKPNFLKAVQLGSFLRRKGSEKAREKIDAVLEQADSLHDALKPIVNLMED